VRFLLGALDCGLYATLHLPARIDDRPAANRAARAGIWMLPLSRCAGALRRLNGWLIGYAAWSDRRIAAGIARLAGEWRARRVTSRTLTPAAAFDAAFPARQNFP
jgi:DNA-binding transcriptional MocR family regulator